MRIPPYKQDRTRAIRYFIVIARLAWLVAAVACIGWTVCELIPTVARRTEVTELQVTWPLLQSFLIWVFPGILVALTLHTMAGITSFLAGEEGPPLSAVHHAQALLSGRRGDRAPQTVSSHRAKAKAVREVIAWQHGSDQDK